MQTGAMTTTPPPAARVVKTTLIQAIKQVHKLACETIQRLNPADSPQTAVTLSDLDDPTFIHLPSGGQALIYTLQVLNLPHEQKAKAGAIANLLKQMYRAGWGSNEPGLVNVFSADDEAFGFGNANGGTFVLQFIW